MRWEPLHGWRWEGAVENTHKQKQWQDERQERKRILEGEYGEKGIEQR